MKTSRRQFLARSGLGGLSLAAWHPSISATDAAEMSSGPIRRPPEGWYDNAFFLLHLDHHTNRNSPAGEDADPAETDRLLALLQPDVIQMHAKGAPGYTTYPSAIGHNPVSAKRDVLAIWRDIARRRGYAWSIYFNFGRDAENMKRHPAWNRVDVEGTLRDNAHCYHSGVLEEYLLPMIGELIERYDPDAFWFDGSCFTVATCYCAKCQDRFKRQAGLALPKNFNAPGWDEFREMQRQVYREAIAMATGFIKQRKPKCRVVFNWAYSLHMPEEPTPGIDNLTGDIANDVDRLTYNAHWLDSQPLPFDLMTTIFYRDDKSTAHPKPVGQMQQEMAVIIANGGRFHAWDNPTAGSGLVAERMEYVGKAVAPFLRARQSWCVGTVRQPIVSLLYTSTHHYADLRNPAPCFLDAGRVSASLIGAADTLQQAHLDYEMISRERLLSGKIKTPFLFAEDLAAAKSDEVAALQTWVEKGGTLILTGRGLAVPELAALAGLRPASGDRSPSAAAAVHPTWQTRLGGDILKLDLPLQSVETIPGGKGETLLAVQTEGPARPLMTLGRARLGKVLAIACRLFSEIKGEKQEPPALRTLRRWVLDQAVPGAERSFTTDAPDAVEMVLRKKDSLLVLHLVNRAKGDRNFYPSKHPQYRITNIPPVAACRVSLRLPAQPSQVTLQPSGQKLEDWQYLNSHLELAVPGFKIHQMIAIQI